MTARARSQRRVTGGHFAVAAPRDGGKVVARRPTRPAGPIVKKPSGFGAGVIASAEHEATQGSFLMQRLASPSALFMVGALGYAVYEIVAAMFTAR